MYRKILVKCFFFLYFTLDMLGGNEYQHINCSPECFLNVQKDIKTKYNSLLITRVISSVYFHKIFNRYFSSLPFAISHHYVTFHFCKCQVMKVKDHFQEDNIFIIGNRYDTSYPISNPMSLPFYCIVVMNSLISLF